MHLTPDTSDSLLLLHDVQARLPKLPNGACAYSARWIREHVAPAKSRIVAGRWAVSARDFEAWHARWVANTLTDDDLSRRVRPRHARIGATNDLSDTEARRAS